MRNVDSCFNKKKPIEHMVEVNIYYQRHKKGMEINMIRDQRWSIILEILQLIYHNSEIDWRTGKVKFMRCPEKCGKQQRPKQGKSGWQKQKEKNKEEEKKQEEKKQKKEEKRQKRKKPKKERTMEVKKVAEEQEIWNEEEAVGKSKEKVKKLVPK